MKTLVSVILLSILVLVSCNTTKNSQYRRDNRFPITIISGEVELQITGYNTNNNEIDGLAYFFADENTKAKMDNYNKDIEFEKSINQTIRIVEIVKEGDQYFYPVKENQIITVSINAINEKAMIECSSIVYQIFKGDGGKLLVFRK
jgi:hypothetical protein